MPEKNSDSGAEAGGGRKFVPTSWSAINAVQQDLPNAREALERLCRTYWFPLYSYVRRRGYNQHDAEDLTQAFFYQILEKNYLGAVDRTKGKFRSFLLASLKHFLENDRDYHRAAKRGGGKVIISLDDDTAEDRYRQEPASDLTPDKVFERNWARTLLAEAQERLREEYHADGKTELFEGLKEFLSDETGMGDYNKIATAMGMKPNTIAVTVRRLRQRYRELIREEVARTVARPGEVDGEMRHLYRALGA